ncbi:hypothetical protein RFI_29729 [Reticulomyxa filosa]|uniref:Uncharacterized protein n=1 Tax=Reticulomyxa filosa TaxID=46433 RepID=X6M199_RETFI|nr:hypothetical protein RFI_29729 [Reticulomyxa filosa]|eukprot:ETO07664.1 hypothetical protein RFI_29729 [Reticulomyxa filosa]
MPSKDLFDVMEHYVSLVLYGIDTLLLLVWLVELFCLRKQKCKQMPAAFIVVSASLGMTWISGTLFFLLRIMLIAHNSSHSDLSASINTLGLLCHYVALAGLICKWISKFCIWFFYVIRGRAVASVLHTNIRWVVKKSPYFVAANCMGFCVALALTTGGGYHEHEKWCRYTVPVWELLVFLLLGDIVYCFGFLLLFWKRPKFTHTNNNNKKKGYGEALNQVLQNMSQKDRKRTTSYLYKHLVAYIVQMIFSVLSYTYLFLQKADFLSIGFTQFDLTASNLCLFFLFEKRQRFYQKCLRCLCFGPLLKGTCDDCGHCNLALQLFSHHRLSSGIDDNKKKVHSPSSRLDLSSMPSSSPSFGSKRIHYNADVFFSNHWNDTVLPIPKEGIPENAPIPDFAKTHILKTTMPWHLTDKRNIELAIQKINSNEIDAPSSVDLNFEPKSRETIEQKDKSNFLKNNECTVLDLLSFSQEVTSLTENDKAGALLVSIHQVALEMQVQYAKANELLGLQDRGSSKELRESRTAIKKGALPLSQASQHPDRSADTSTLYAVQESRHSHSSKNETSKTNITQGRNKNNDDSNEQNHSRSQGSMSGHSYHFKIETQADELQMVAPQRAETKEDEALESPLPLQSVMLAQGFAEHMHNDKKLANGNAGHFKHFWTPHSTDAIGSNVKPSTNSSRPKLLIGSASDNTQLKQSQALRQPSSARGYPPNINVGATVLAKPLARSGSPQVNHIAKHVPPPTTQPNNVSASSGPLHLPRSMSAKKYNKNYHFAVCFFLNFFLLLLGHIPNQLYNAVVDTDNKDFLNVLPSHQRSNVPEAESPDNDSDDEGQHEKYQQRECSAPPVMIHGDMDVPDTKNPLHSQRVHVVNTEGTGRAEHTAKTTEKSLSMSVRATSHQKFQIFAHTMQSSIRSFVHRSEYSHSQHSEKLLTHSQEEENIPEKGIGHVVNQDIKTEDFYNLTKNDSDDDNETAL